MSAGSHRSGTGCGLVMTKGACRAMRDRIMVAFSAVDRNRSISLVAEVEAMLLQDAPVESSPLPTARTMSRSNSTAKKSDAPGLLSSNFAEAIHRDNKTAPPRALLQAGQ